MGFDYEGKTTVYKRGECAFESFKRAELILFKHTGSQLKDLATLFIVVIGPVIALMVNLETSVVVAFGVFYVLLACAVINSEFNMLSLKERGNRLCFSERKTEDHYYSAKFDEWYRNVCSLSDLLIVGALSMFLEVLVIKSGLLPSGLSFLLYMTYTMMMPALLFAMYFIARKVKGWPFLFDGSLVRAFFSDLADARSSLNVIREESPADYAKLRTHFVDNKLSHKAGVWVL